MLVAASVASAVHDEALRCLPRESCGVLLGRTGWVDEAVPLPNASSDPRRAYALDPEALLAVDREARRRSLAIVGYYHSHPTGSAEPSPTDLASAWPETLYLIAAIEPDGEIEICGWWLPDGGARFEPVDLERIESSEDHAAQRLRP